MNPPNPTPTTLREILSKLKSIEQEAYKRLASKAIGVMPAENGSLTTIKAVPIARIKEELLHE